MGHVSILVNNDGIVSGTALLDTPDSKIIRTFDVNILAHFWTLKAFLPAMISRQDGHIVNVASLAGHSGINKLVDYCASKFAAVGLDESLRVELFVQVRSLERAGVRKYISYLSTMTAGSLGLHQDHRRLSLLYFHRNVFWGSGKARGLEMCFYKVLQHVAEQNNPNPGTQFCC